MKTAVLIIHMLVSTGLIALILLQSSKGGLGGAFGGADYQRSRRGAERVVFTSTIVLSVLFFITSVVNLIVH